MSTPYKPGISPRPTDASLTAPTPPMPTWCRKCRQSIGATDTYCKHCGTRQNANERFYYHPLWILVLSFTVLGPFALGLVWRSQRMNTTVKAVLAAVIIAYTAFSFYALYAIGAAVYQEFSLLDQIM